MTEILFKKLKERFPPIEDYERVSIYGAYERIYLNLIENVFSKIKKHFDSQEKIIEVASKTFDVNFICKLLNEGGERRLSVIFEPIILEKEKMSYESFRYNQNHSEHSIEVILASLYPMITISTGNRGAVDLFPRQRNNYYNFIEGIYGLFVWNALK